MRVLLSRFKGLRAISSLLIVCCIKLRSSNGTIRFVLRFVLIMVDCRLLYGLLTVCSNGSLVCRKKSDYPRAYQSVEFVVLERLFRDRLALWHCIKDGIRQVTGIRNGTWKTQRLTNSWAKGSCCIGTVCVCFLDVSRVSRPFVWPVHVGVVLRKSDSYDWIHVVSPLSQSLTLLCERDTTSSALCRETLWILSIS